MVRKAYQRSEQNLEVRTFDREWQMLEAAPRWLDDLDDDPQDIRGPDRIESGYDICAGVALGLRIRTDWGSP